MHFKFKENTIFNENLIQNEKKKWIFQIYSWFKIYFQIPLGNIQKSLNFTLRTFISLFIFREFFESTNFSVHKSFVDWNLKFKWIFSYQLLKVNPSTSIDEPNRNDKSHWICNEFIVTSRQVRQVMHVFSVFLDWVYCENQHQVQVSQKQKVGKTMYTFPRYLFLEIVLSNVHQCNMQNTFNWSGFRSQLLWEKIQWNNLQW